MPRPTLIATRFSARWPSAPNVYSARAAARLSLATLDGRPYRSWRRPPSGRSCQSRLTAQRIVPVRASTRPGVPTPMPRGVAVDSREELVDEAVDEVERGVAVAAVDRQLDDAANLAAEVDERAREDALAEVEADDLAGVVDDAEEDRGLAAGRRAPTDLLDQALVEQLADDVADGRAGQAGEAGDLGAADRPEVVEGPQHEALVVLAGLRVGRLGRESHPLGVPRLVRPSVPAPPQGLCPRTGQSAGCDVIRAMSSVWTKPDGPKIGMPIPRQPGTGDELPTSHPRARRTVRGARERSRACQARLLAHGPTARVPTRRLRPPPDGPTSPPMAAWPPAARRGSERQALAIHGRSAARMIREFTRRSWPERGRWPDRIDDGRRSGLSVERLALASRLQAR